MIDLRAVAPALERHEPGIWFSRGQAAVSYPAEGNARCLTVEDRSFWFKHRNRCIVNLVRHFAPDGVFLDVGGGNGFVARGLIAAGIDCILLEPGIDGALAAHARGVEPVICATLAQSGLPPASVHAAGMFDVLEHIKDDVAALTQVHRICKPDGWLFLTVPAYQFLYSDDDAAAGHFRRYTLSSIGRALRSAGFEVKFASYMFAPLPPLMFLFRTLPSRIGMRSRLTEDCDATDHAPSCLAAKILDRLLDAEFARFAAGRSVPFGGSCLVAARKV